MNATQKNVMYAIINQLQKSLSLNQTLFGEQIIPIDLKTIDKGADYRFIKKEVKKLIGKVIEYDIASKNTNGEKIVTEYVTTLVSSFAHEKNSATINIYIPSAALPFLCYIGDGFTQLRHTIAITLNSKFSKRLYELCFKWMTGKNAPRAFKMTIAEFVTLNKLPDTYLKPSFFESRVLKVAQEELKEVNDVWFNYSIKKRGKGDYLISFKCLSSDPKLNEGLSLDDSPNEWYGAVYSVLQKYVYEHEGDIALRVCDELQATGKMRQFYLSLDKKLDKLLNGGEDGYKSRKHFINTVIMSLDKDFGIPKPR